MSGPPRSQMNPENREKMLVRPTPCAPHDLYIEVKDLDVEASQMGHRVEIVSWYIDNSLSDEQSH